VSLRYHLSISDAKIKQYVRGRMLFGALAG